MATINVTIDSLHNKGFSIEEIAEIMDMEPADVNLYIDDMIYRESKEAWDGFNSDAEADADVLRSAGWGTDESYGYYGDGDY